MSDAHMSDNTIEDRVRTHLNEAADAVDVQFSAADIKARAHGEPSTDATTRGRPMLAVAASIAVLGGIAFATLRPTESEMIAVGEVSTTADVATPPTEAPEPMFTELNLTAIDRAADQLGPDAIVLGGDQVDVVEIGPPSDEMISANTELASTLCIATTSSLACRPTGTDQTNVTATNEDNRPVAAIAADDGIWMLIENDGQVVVAGLPDNVVTVTFVAGRATEHGRYQRTPVAGAAPFPLSSGSTWFEMQALAADGSIVFDSDRVLIAPAPNPLCGSTEIPVDFRVEGANESGFVRFVTQDATMVERYELTNGDRVEFLWPPTPRPLYNFDGELGTFRFPQSTGGFDGSSSTMRMQPQTSTDEAVGPAIEVEVTSAVETRPGCEFVEVRSTDGETGETVSFGFDLTAAPRDWPLTDLLPRITSTETVAAIPQLRITSCDDPDQPNTDDAIANLGLYGSPAEAFYAFMNTDAAWTLIDSGWHEMVADGTVAYGMPFDDVPGGPTSQTSMISIVEVTETADGWRVTNLSGSGC